MGVFSSPNSLQLLVIVERIDALLQKLERREEDCVNGARAAHRDTQSTVHVPSEELDLHRRDFLSPGIHEAVSLIYALRGIYWVLKIVSRNGSELDLARTLTNHSPRHNST